MSDDGMPDDRRIAELFRAAASDSAAPPAGFGHADVVMASRRITARRRSAVLGGLVVLAVVGVGAAVGGTDLLRGDTTSTAAAPAAAPEGAADSAAGDAGLPGALRGLPPYTGSPLGPGTTGCADRQDPALRSLVEQVLPEVTGATPAATTDVCLPGSQRYLNIEVRDGAAAGLLTVGYLPPGSIVSLAPGVTATPTASGGTVLVGSRGDGANAPVPFEGRLDTLAAFLAPRL